MAQQTFLNTTSIAISDLNTATHPNIAVSGMASVLVVFDTRVQDLGILYSALVPGAVGYTIDAQEDALAVITRLLTQTGAQRLAIVAHGEPGVVQMGAQPLKWEQLQAKAHLLQEWGVEEIALYSCEVGKDVGFVTELERLTGARVAASTRKVGATEQGGSWELNKSLTSPVFEGKSLERYQDTLPITSMEISGVNNTTDTNFSAGEAKALTLTYNLTQPNLGNDLLMGIYSSTGTLLYWQSFRNSNTNQSLISTSFDLLAALGSYNGSFHFRFWQGSTNTATASGSYNGTSPAFPSSSVSGFNYQGQGGSSVSSNIVDWNTSTIYGLNYNTEFVTIDNFVDNVGSIQGTYTSNGTVTDDTTPTLNGRALPGAIVTIRNGTTVLGTATTGTNGQWTFTPATPLSTNGIYNITASIANGTNITASSNPFTLTLDTIAPGAPTIALVSADDRVNSNEKTAGVTVSGTAEANSTVNVTWGGTTLQATTDANGNWSRSFTNAQIPADGSTNIRVTATDVAGNVSTAGTRPVVIDTLAPNAPVIGQVAGDDRVNSSEKTAGVTVSGTAEANSTVNVTWGGTTLQATADANGNWSRSFTTAQIPADGSTNIRVTATDAAGNVSTDGTRSVTIDTVAPNVSTITNVTDDVGSILGTVANNGQTDDTTPTIAISLSGTNAVAGDTITLLNGTTQIATYTLTAADITAGSASITSSALAEGSYSLTARITDVAGNQSAASTVRSFTIDTTAPNAPTIAQVAGDDQVNSSEKTAGVTVSGTAEANSTVNVTWGGTTLQATANGSGSWTAAFATAQIPADGSTNITVTATDAAGNVSTAGTRPVLIDTLAPNAPVIGQVAGDDQVNSSEKTAGVTVSGTAEANSTVNVTWGGTTLQATANGSGSWTAAFATAQIPADGSPNITVTATDAAGNLSTTGTRPVLIDTLAPNAPVIGQVAGDDQVNSSEKTAGVTVSGTAEANSTVNVTWGETTLQATTDANGNWSSSFASNQIPADGSTNISVTATDASGNVSTTGTRPVLIDTVALAPDVALTNDTGSSNSDRISNNGALTISAESGATIEYSLDGQTWTNSFTPVEGANTVQVRQTDVAGNTSAATPYTFTLDTVAPTTPTINEFSNVTGNILTLAGTADAGSTVTIFSGTTALGTAVANSDGSWSFDTTSLTDDTFSVRAGATDVAGNTSPASAATTIIAGNAGNDTLNGGDGDEVVVGYVGNDILNGGKGNDTLLGGAGDDSYVVDSSNDLIIEYADGGTDIVFSSVNWTLGENLENLTLTETAAINGTGNALNNIITGNEADNILSGGAGDDTLNGGAGNDTLDGGTGNDSLIGGAGNDTYVVDSLGDRITEDFNGGIDLVTSSITWTLGDNLENLTLIGTEAINGTGNALNNTIIGNAANNTLDGSVGNDTLNGGAGDDTLIGGTGNDTYVVDSLGDIIVEKANEGIDLVTSSITWTLGDNLENLTLTGTAAINGTGNALNNNIIGNAANNTLWGGEGNDTLNGGGGNDILIGGAGDDIYIVDRPGAIIVEDASGGREKVFSSITWTLGDNLEELRLTGSADINGTGNALNNHMAGNAGNNWMFGGLGNDDIRGWGGNDTLLGEGGSDFLVGGDGNDLLIGGAGNDSLQGGTGSDTFIYNGLSDGSDSIHDFSISLDRLDLTGLFQSLDYKGSNPMADGFMRLVQMGTNTAVQIDADGSGSRSGFTTVVSLLNVSPSNLTVGSNIDTNNILV